ncbi:histidine phosphatase family protein [Thiolapillus sp.]
MQAVTSVKTTRIDLIRHGEPRGGRLYRGANIDDPLSEKGWRQMWRAVGEQNHWQQIVSSPMLRCLAFAQALAHRHGLPVSTENNFREVGFGDWEGSSPDEIKQTRPREYRAFYADPVSNRPRNAEDLHQFGDRIATALEQTAARFHGQNILIVAHAGVIRAALGYVLEAPAATWYRTRINNAGISRFLFTSQGKQLVFHNLPRLQGGATDPPE